MVVTLSWDGLVQLLRKHCLALLCRGGVFLKLAVVWTVALA